MTEKHYAFNKAFLTAHGYPSGAIGKKIKDIIRYNRKLSIQTGKERLQCPRCNSNYTFKAGFSPRGVQRYKCNECQKKFTEYKNAKEPKSTQKENVKIGRKKRWTNQIMNEFLKDYNQLSTKELMNKYKIKTINNVYTYHWQFKKATRQTENITNPNMKFKEQVLKGLKGE